MELEMRSFAVHDAFFSDETSYAKGNLSIKRAELDALLHVDGDPFESIEICIAKPGDNCRIIHVLDVIEPRAKLSKEVSPYPGFLIAVQDNR